MTTETHTPDTATYWRRGALRGFVFAVAFTLAFEAMRGFGVGIRLSTPYVMLIGALGGAAWAALYAGLRIYLKSTLAKIAGEGGAPSAQTTTEDGSHG